MSIKIEKLVLCGVDAFRINCSHTKISELKSYIENIRRVEKKLKSNYNRKFVDP